MKNYFDIIIIGGGHAGVEAAWTSSQFDLKILLISAPGVSLASTPCNPAIGGVGKGQVVREIDALGGLMGVLADRSGIQYRTLNESKGFALQSTRVQVDKELYTKYAEEVLSSRKNLKIVREMVEAIEPEDNKFLIRTELGNEYFSSKVVVTTGTFLKGRLHTGELQVDGGRFDCKRSVGLNDLFSKIKMQHMRFKTGTPPRIDKSSIDYSQMEPQESDPQTRNFSFHGELFKRNSPQVPCYLTRTNNRTLEIIRANKERSPIFNGQIEGMGPRYCPSIEDKAFRYTEKDIHHVFIEPEGLDLETIYPNGISTSLPRDVQEEFLHTIGGLENAKILVYGYAVEYDVVDTSMLGLTMEVKDVPGLYFAGQVCGTSGYEEAAGQGLIAGINSALSLMGKGPFILSREDSYIGVMIDDLVSTRRDEPYRLFTARSENRLSIREDNTILRMNKYRRSLGLKNELDLIQESFLEEMALLEKLLSTNSTLKEILRRPNLNPILALQDECKRVGAFFSNDVIKTVAISAKYEGYIDRALAQSQKISKLSKKRIDWREIVESQNISFECKSRIKESKPETFGHLQKIDGIRPASLAFVAGNLL